MPATNQSAVSTLIREVLADPDLAHDDVFRRLLQAGLQDLVDAEAAAVIGAGRYERTPERTNRRNGTRPKTVATTAGEVEAGHPQASDRLVLPVPAPPAQAGGQGPVRRDLLRVDRGGLHAQGGRPGAGPGQRVRDLQVHGLADLQGDRRGRARVPVPPPGPHLVPLPVRRAPRTWTCAWGTGWSAGRWWWPPACRPKAAGRSWAWPWATPRRSTSGRPCLAVPARAGAQGPLPGGSHRGRAGHQ